MIGVTCFLELNQLMKTHNMTIYFVSLEEQKHIIILIIIIIIIMMMMIIIIIIMS